MKVSRVMKQWKSLFVLFNFVVLINWLLPAQDVYTTQIFSPNIRTLQMKINGDPLSLPILKLGGTDVLECSFDEMSHERHSYSYEIIHCNADWTASSLSTSEYLQGFSRGYIDNYALSVNTTFLYTHYSFILPNGDVNFLVSGNFVVRIFEDNNSENPIAEACFMVVEPKVDIDASVRGNTDTELNRTKQQLDFVVSLQNYNVQDAVSEMKVVVRQNDRLDNQVTDLKPTFFSGNKLNFTNNRKLIFEGGNEYHRFDFSSIYNYDQRIDRIKFEKPYYQVYLEDNHIQKEAPYEQDFDANGRFVINYQNNYDNNEFDVEADYMFVNFYLPVEKPFDNGSLYLGGYWNYNLMNGTSRMEYDSSNQLYFKTLLLKQGGYNYQYWYLPQGTSTASVEPVDGSHWQTQNQYAIYVYHRPWGGRYDKLIGVKIIQ